MFSEGLSLIFFLNKVYASIYVNLERTIDVYKGIQITDLLKHFRMFRRLIHMVSSDPSWVNN